MGRHQWTTRAILVASASGIVSVLLIALVNGSLLLDEEDAGATTLGALAFPIVLLAPFVVLAASCSLQDVSQQRAIWLGCAVTTLGPAVLTMFSVGITFLLIGLTILWSRLVTSPKRTSAKTWLSPLLSLWFVVTFGSAAFLLLIWRETPACWSGDGWQRIEGGSGLLGSSLAQPGTCASDINDSVEAAIALGSVAAGITGLFCCCGCGGWASRFRQRRGG